MEPFPPPNRFARFSCLVERQQVVIPAKLVPRESGEPGARIFLTP